MAENVKGLNIVLGMDTKQLQQGISNVYKNLKKLNKVQSTLTKLSASAVALGTAFMATATKVSSAIDEIADSATESGLGVEQYQKLTYALDQLGISSATSSQAMRKVNSAIAKVADGSGKEIVRVLNKLGISWQDFIKMDSETAFYALADAMGKVGNDAELLSDITKVFGDELATKLLPAIDAGSDKLKSLGEEAVVVTSEQTEMSKKFSTSVDKFKQLAVVLGANLLPLATQIMEIVNKFVQSSLVPKISELAEKINGMSDRMKGFIGVIFGVVSSLGPLFKIGTSIYKLVGTSLPKALSVLSAHPIIAVIGIVITMLTTLYKTNDEFKKSIDELIKNVLDLMKPLLEELMMLLKPIGTLISGVLNVGLKLLGAILTPIVNAISKFVEFLTPVINAINSMLAPALEAINGLLESMFGWIEDVIDGFDKLFGQSDKWVEKTRNDPLWKPFYNVTDEQQGGFTPALKQANKGAGGTSSGTGDTRNYYITINTTADHMSLDDLDAQLGDAM